MYDTVFASIDSDLNRFVIHEILIEKQMKIETKRNDRLDKKPKKEQIFATSTHIYRGSIWWAKLVVWQNTCDCV